MLWSLLEHRLTVEQPGLLLCPTGTLDSKKLFADWLKPIFPSHFGWVIPALASLSFQKGPFQDKNSIFGVKILVEQDPSKTRDRCFRKNRIRFGRHRCVSPEIKVGFFQGWEYFASNNIPFKQHSIQRTLPWCVPPLWATAWQEDDSYCVYNLQLYEL